MSKENSRDIYPELGRRPRCSERDHSEQRWLVSYADFITLLFAFFVVMYAISSVNEGKYKKFNSAIQDAFREKGGTGSGRIEWEREDVLKSLIDQQNAHLALIQRQQQESLDNMAKNLTRALSPLVNRGMVSVSRSGRGIVIDMNVQVLFQEGEAVLQNRALAPLDAVAGVLRDNPLPIEVQGSTDDTPISNGLYPSNWELSTARACSVVRLFVQQGVGGKRLTASGVADYQPVAPNDSPQNKARNRRVTVTLLTPQPLGPGAPAEDWSN